MKDRAHGSGEEGRDHHEALRKVTVMLEEEQVVMLKKLAEEYSRTLGPRWTFSAVMRVAVGDFLTKMGRFS